ncbi:hypothetical protein LTR91_013897 [Friedmanniomyces endolithicus]|uniref:Uncharacterized protein n=1 Tax=Friedmanniomyces endolithicus TaxID=329885 RepID=A0AAN6KCP4_9PEZI|nr:hypothetical protein LTS02_003518 [Friedmanniomyces endolithicus]KAK0884104.1 hypothetical protein LTR87_002043 [Friedmanniomyces endolithicus]KAK0918324.1 hypothetical protein LTR57_011811 [Friedmanniomyces endolithicus]KAK0961776.1 hypothetical protein LTS01_020161 [Friedmanniomyces endolithicus]KAK0975755.1 hypothetical protein LTR91_013897 [Friedmanniomyces endolithicus]
MAPKKSDLLTAGTTNPWEKKPYPLFPLTTQGKIAKAAAQREKLQKSTTLDTPKIKKPSTPKRCTLPPPAEMAALAKTLAKRKADFESEGSGKPMTTQQKIRAAEAKKKKRDPFGLDGEEMARAGQEEVERTRGKQSAEAKKASKARPSGRVNLLHNFASTTIRFAEDRVGDAGDAHLAVMSRRTKKAERWMKQRRDKILTDPDMKKLWIDEDVQKALKASKGKSAKLLPLLKKDVILRGKLVSLLSGGLLPAPGVELDAVDLHGKRATFRLMDLPKELRCEIYSFVVVERKILIRPDSVTGREQPDLAMVSREVREEVLPIFYAKNTFAIDVTETCGMRPVGYRSGLEIAEVWAKAIDSGSSSFSYIRNWIFDFPGPLYTRSDECKSDRSLMLSVRFKKDSTNLWTAKVEVHCDASCIMPGFEEHGSCNIMLTPEWVNELVIAACDSAKGGSMTAEVFKGLARALKLRMSEVVGSRCELVEVVDSIEHGV